MSSRRDEEEEDNGLDYQDPRERRTEDPSNIRRENLEQSIRIQPMNEMYGGPNPSQNYFIENLMLQQARQIQLLQQQLSMVDPTQQANLMKMNQINMQLGMNGGGMGPGPQPMGANFKGNPEGKGTGKKEGPAVGGRDPMNLSVASAMSAGSNLGFPGGPGFNLNDQGFTMNNLSSYSGLGNPLQQSSHFIYPPQQGPGNKPANNGPPKESNSLAKKIDDLFNYNMDALNSFYTAHNMPTTGDYGSKARPNPASHHSTYADPEIPLEDSGFHNGSNVYGHQNSGPGSRQYTQNEVGFGQTKNKRERKQPMASPKHEAPLDKREFLKKNNFMDDVFGEIGSSQRDSIPYNDDEDPGDFVQSKTGAQMGRGNKRANPHPYPNKTPNIAEENQELDRFDPGYQYEEEDNLDQNASGLMGTQKDKMPGSFVSEKMSNNSTLNKDPRSPDVMRNSVKEKESHDKGKVSQSVGPVSSNPYDEMPLPAIKNNPNFQAPEYNDEEEGHNKEENDRPISKVPGKTFEELLEDKMAEEAGTSSKGVKKPAKKPFLKKGTRQFLSSAIHRGEKKKQGVGSSEVIEVNEEKESEEEVKPKVPEKKVNKPAPRDVKKEKPEKKNTGSSSNIKAQSDNIKSEEPANGAQPVEKKKFLTRGSGVGGGKKKGEDATPKGKNEEEKKLGESKEVKKKAEEPQSFGKKEKTREVQVSYDPSHYLNSVKNDSEPENEESDEEYYKKPKKGLSDEDQRNSEEMFDDNEEWGESGNPKSKSSIHEAEPKTSMGKPSKVVEKYFGGEELGKFARGDQPTAESVPVLSREVEEKIAKKYVNEKIESLNAEVARLKLENERVLKMRQGQEEKVKKLQKEKDEFERMKAEELANLEEFKQEEMRKIKKERQIAERNSKAIANMPNRKEREEIENLNKEIQKLREELKLKEKRNRMNEERMKKQIEELTSEKNDLQDQVRQLEQLRLQGDTEKQGKPAAKATKEILEMKAGKPAKKESISEKKEEPAAKKTVEAKGKPGAKGKAREPEEENSGDHQKYEDILVKGKTKEATLAEVKRKIIEEEKAQKESDEEEVEVEKYEDRSVSQSEGEEKEEEEKEKEETNQTETGKPETKKQPFNHDEYKYSSNEHYIWYTKTKDAPRKLVNQTVSNDGKIQKIYADGKKEILFPNGVKREVFNNGFIIVHFANSDIKQTLPDGTIVYYFAEADTTQTTIPATSTNIYSFSNKQTELHYNDGSKEIKFADGTQKIIYANGEEETLFVDGTIQRLGKNRIKTIEYPNGEKDTHHPDGTKMKVFPNGTVKRLA